MIIFWAPVMIASTMHQKGLLQKEVVFKEHIDSHSVNAQAVGFFLDSSTLLSTEKIIARLRIFREGRLGNIGNNNGVQSIFIVPRYTTDYRVVSDVGGVVFRRVKKT